MPNSSYSIYIANDGAGVFTPTARRNPTAASGGTTLSLPTDELFTGVTAQTNTLLLYLAIDAAKRRILNDYTSNPTASYSIDIVNNGSDLYTPTVRRNPTAPSGGTVLSLPADELFAGVTSQTTTLLIYLAIDASKRRILNDRAAGN